MVRLWAAILLIGVLAQSFSRQVIFTEFLVKKDFIAQMLCEKKGEPENGCQGKCHLKKQLEKDNERQERNNQNLKSNLEVLFSQDISKLTIHHYQESFESFCKVSCSSIQKGHLAGIFHPPSC